MLKYKHNLDMTTRNSHSIILQQVSPGSRVLELGPATGYMTRYMKEELNCKVVCVEVDPQSARQAEPYSEKMIVANLNQSQWWESLQGEQFDYVICADVLEHLMNPIDTLSRAVSLLRSEGTAVVSVPNIGHNAIIMDLMKGKFEYRDLGLLDNTHVRFFTRDNLLAMIDQAGLHPISLSATFSAPEETEFAQSYSSFSQSTRAELLNNKDGHVYQFIVTAQRKEIASSVATTYPIDFERDAYHFQKAMQLFWKVKGQFLEEHSRTVLLEEDRTTYVIDLPAGIDGDIRLDPISESGVVQLFNVNVFEVTSQGDRESVLIDLTYSDSIHRVDGTDWLVCKDSDPQIHFHLPKIDDDAHYQVAVELAYSEDTIDVATRLLKESSDLLQRQYEENAHLLQTQAAKEEQITHLLLEQTKQNELVGRLESRLNDKETQFEVYKEKLSRVETQLQELISSTSWKVTSPLRALGRVARDPRRSLKDIYYLLSRTKVRPELIPIQQVNQNTDGKWESTGDDPQFALNKWPTGLVRLRMSFASDKALRGPIKLYFDRGRYYNEEDSIVLAHNNREVKHDFYIDPSVISIRLDPCEGKGEFLLENIRFQRMSWLELKIRHRVGTLLGRSRKVMKFLKYGRAKLRDWKEKHGRYPHPSEISMLVRKAYYEWKNRHQASLEGELKPPPNFVLESRMDPYEAWLESNQWNDRRKFVLQGKLTQIQDKKLLSIIMPVYNPPIEFFERAIESVRNQLYDHWELCLADDASTNPEVRAVINKWLKIDSRIKAVFCEKNGNISRATNAAASIAQGDYYVFMDNDDELTPDALSEVALYINQHPNSDVIYSDDDKIDSNGKRFAPQFKPDWSPELLLSFMYFSHLFVVKSSLFQAVGGMRVGFEGSQDYDLALRVTEQACHVGHIPRILYHWRVLPGSTAASGDAKPASFEAGRRAVQEALDRRGVNAQSHQPEWARKAACGIFAPVFPNSGPKVTILIPTKNGHAILKQCLESLKKTSYQNYDVVIIDNDSDDPASLQYLQSIEHRVIRISNPNGKFNYAHIHNEAVKNLDCTFVLFLNNDTEVLAPEWLSQMVGYMQFASVGAVGARLLFPDGRIQHAGITHGYYRGMAGPSFKLLPSWNNGYMSLAKVSRNTSAVTAACMLTSKDLFLQMGGFDEKNFAVAYNDVDYCYRLHNAGFRIVYCPEAELKHYEGFSRGFADNPAEGAAFRKKYAGFYDPYYNPNLSLDSERFEIRSITRAEEDLNPVRTLMCAFNLNWEGAPYSQYELTVKLKEQGIIEPIVFCPQDGPLRKAYEDKGIPVIVSPHPLAGVFGEEAYQEAIRHFCEQVHSWNVEIVYGNTLQTFYAIEAAKRLDLPSIWNPRESEPWETYFNHHGPEIAAHALECFKYPYQVVFVADATRNGFSQLDTHLNFGTIHNGLDRNRLLDAISRVNRDELRSSMNIAAEDTVVLLLGTVCERKGQHDLIEAIQLLDESVSQSSRFIIVGDRPSDYSSRLKQKIEALDEKVRSRVIVVPETSDAPEYFALADVFVCTSRIESFPRVILEAMAAGLPVISTPVYGIVEQIQDGVNGLFYNPEDTTTLAAHLTNLIANQHLRRTMGVNSRYVLDLINDYEAMAKAYGRVFREAWLTGGAR